MLRWRECGTRFHDTPASPPNMENRWIPAGCHPAMPRFIPPTIQAMEEETRTGLKTGWTVAAFLPEV